MSESPGSVIGPYTLMEPIGEGGMGTVYMAEQTTPVRRRVALIEGLRITNGPHADLPIGHKLRFAQACLRAGDLDRSDQILRGALIQIEKEETSHDWRRNRSNANGWLALTLHLAQRNVEAESLIQKTLEFHRKEYPDSPRTFYWESVLGAILLGQQRYAEAEDLIVRGYEGIKQREKTDAFAPMELVEAGGRVVQYFRATHQPEKTQAWLEKLAVVHVRE